MTKKSADDLPQVPRKHPDAICEACPLYEGDYVPSLMTEHPRLAVVGEAPGENEVIQARPFVGRAGWLLGKSLGQIIDMDGEVALLNSVSCRPPDGNSKPKWTAVKACRPRLLAELQALNPTMIMSMGASSLQSLRNDRSLGILANRAKPFISEETGKEVYPTVHPSFVLREGGNWPDFKKDLEDGVERLEAIEGNVPVVPFDMPKVTIISDPEVAIRTIQWVKKNYSAISFDIETGSVLNRIRFKRDAILCVGLSYGEGNEGIVFTDDVLANLPARRWIVALISDETIVKVLQNGKFDQKFTNAQWGADMRVDYDTMLASYALDERKSIHSLEYLIDHVLHAPDYKRETDDWMDGEKRRRRLHNMRARRAAKKEGRPAFQDELLPDPTFADMPRDMLHRRAAYDAALTMRVAHVQVDRLRKDGLWPLSQLLFRAGNRYAQMETRGLLIDHSYRARLAREMADELREMEAAIKEMVGIPTFNPHSPEQVSDYLFETLKLTVPKIAWGRNKHNADIVQKRPSSAKDVLKELVGSHPFPQAILDLRATKKLKSSYVDNLDLLLCDCGRLHPDWKLHGTVTGRRSEPIMTVPKPKVGKPNMRALVTATPGYKLLEVDYKAGELRVAAALSNDEIMREALLNGEDLHDRLMRELDMPSKEAQIALLGDDDGVKAYETDRRGAKIVNFGVLYGMEEALLAQTIKVPKSTAAEFLRRYWARYVGVAEWMRQVRKAALTTGKLHSPVGRIRRYGLVTDDVRKSIMKEAGNYYPQELLADFTLISLLLLYEWIEFHGWDVHPVLEMHDSLLLEVPDDPSLIRMVAHDLAAFMGFVPKRVLGTDIPFEVEFKVGDRWGELKGSKELDFVPIPPVPSEWFGVAEACGQWLPDSLRLREWDVREGSGEWQRPRTATEAIA